MKTDVFLRLWPESEIRMLMAKAVIERLLMDPKADLHVIIPDPLSIDNSSQLTNTWRALHGNHDRLHALYVPHSTFHITSRLLADQHSLSPVYVIIDDDHLMLYNDWLDNGLEVMQLFPEYGAISAWSVNGEVPLPPPGARGRSQVWESGSIGCPVFVRKGVFSDVPVLPAHGYDTALTQYVQNRSWKTGFTWRVRYNHIGQGFSQVVPQHFDPQTPGV